MKIKAVFFILLLCLCQLAQAQTADSAAFYRHHIGINTRVVLDRIAEPASRMPLQLMYKYQLSRTGAIRFGAEGMYAKSDSTQSFSVRRDEVTYKTLGSSLGYEWQKPLSKLFTIYYGGDVFYRRNKKNIEMFNRFLDPNHSQNQIEIEVDVKVRYVTNTVGLRPFVGLRVNVNKKFYFSTETALSLMSERNTQDYLAAFRTYSKDGAIGNPQTTTDYTTRKSAVSYLPFSAINIQYLF